MGVRDCKHLVLFWRGLVCCECYKPEVNADHSRSPESFDSRFLWRRPGPDTFLLKAAACAMAPSREATASRAGPNPHSSRLANPISCLTHPTWHKLRCLTWNRRRRKKRNALFLFDTCQSTVHISRTPVFPACNNEFLAYLVLHSMAIKDVQPSIEDDSCDLD